MNGQFLLSWLLLKLTVKYRSPPDGSRHNGDTDDNELLNERITFLQLKSKFLLCTYWCQNKPLFGYGYFLSNIKPRNTKNCLSS